MKIVPELLNDNGSLPPVQLNPYDYLPNEEHNHGPIIPKIWSVLIFILNIWTLFSTILWFSAKDHPRGFLIAFEILVELILFFEAFARVIIRIVKPQEYANLNLYHITKNDGFWIMLPLMLGSMPIYTIYSGVSGQLDDSEGISVFSRLLALKILRTFEIWRALSKIEEILFYSQFKTLIFVKFVINFIYVLLITHLSTCSWLFLETTFSGEPMILGKSSTNPYASGIPYYQRNNMTDSSLFEKYADASVWAVSTLTGCSFQDVTPRTLEEVITSILIFLIGIMSLAKIFTDFASIMHLLDVENVQVKEKCLQALKLCHILNIPEEIRFKVQTFYNLDRQVVSQTQYYNEIRELPQTLCTDVMLSLKKKFIGQVNLFSFGPPEFVFMIINYLYPQSSMPGDFIVRVGEYADKMYFIKEGEVEILATDNQTRIGILRAGAYFGEIGLLLTQKRTVTVRALTLCIFETINKKHFDIVMDAFPHQRDFLLQVAQQRVKVTNPEDLEDEIETPKYSKKGTANSSPYTEEKGAEETILVSTKRRFSTFSVYPEGAERYQTAWRRFIEIFKLNACVSKGLDFRSTNVIIPTSRFYHIWLFILGLTVFTNQILVPYEIAFVSDNDTIAASWWVVDVILVIVYLLDIFISINTSVRHKGMYTSDRKYILKTYVSENFALDLIAFCPASYFMNLARMPNSYISWVKLMRFIKIFRLLDLLRDFRKNGERRSRYFQLFELILFHITLNHITACIMYMISKSEYNSGNDCLLKELETSNVVDMPLVDQSSFVQYVYFLYWACSVSSSGAYGDIAAVAPAEKFFEVISLLFFRIYFAFCAAEVATIVSNSYMSYTENLAKTTTYEVWMRQIKLPDKIISRVKKYNQYLWEKYHGLNENQILDDLPSSTRQEILEFLLFDMLETVEIFPNDEVGLFSNIVKDFKFILVTKDEYIFRAGETVEEIFFIIEGEVKILSQDNTIQIALLGRNDFFGETAIIDGKTGIRTENAKAKTNATLGILHLSSIKNMWKKYPTLQEKMNKIAQMRRDTFKKKSSNFRLETEEWILKDTEFEEKPDEIVNLNPSLAKTQYELEFDQLRQELVDVLGEPEPPSRAYPTLLKVSVNNSPSGKQIDEMESPQLKFDGNLKQDSMNTIYIPSMRGVGSIHDVSKLTYRSIAISSKSDLAVITKTIEANETEPANEDKGLTNNVELEETAKIDKGFIASRIEPVVPQRKFRSLMSQVHELRVSLEDRFRKLRISILNTIVLFEWLYRPLNLSLDVTNFKGPMIILEVVFILIFILNFLIDWKDYKIQRKIRQIFPSEGALGQEAVNITNKDDEDSRVEVKHPALSPVILCIDLLYIIPFQMIITLSGVSSRATNIFLIIIQFTRLLGSGRLRKIFQINFFKRRYALGNILFVLIAFTILNHFSACIFIVLAKARPDFNSTWLAKIPAPQFDFPLNSRVTLDADSFTIYLHALYWAYVTTSHVGVGDVTAVNSNEKIYATIIIMTTTFLYAFLFGNLASMVDDLTPKFQREFESHYWKVLEYAKSAKLESFINKIHAYYSYIWTTTKGIDENNILKELPNSLRSDIFLARYSEIVVQSKFFHDERGVTDKNVFYSFSKKFKYGTFMKHDFIITVGQEINDIYIILEGAAEVITYNFNAQKHKHLGPGDYFGGVFANMTQIQNIMASEITKVAILPQSDFFHLKEAFPYWYHNIIKDDKMYQIGHKLLGNLRKLVQHRKDNPPSSRAFQSSSNASSRIEDDGDHHKLSSDLKIETVVSLSPSPMAMNQKRAFGQQPIEDFESGHNRLKLPSISHVPSIYQSSTNPKEIKNLSQFSPKRASVFKIETPQGTPFFNLSSPGEKRSSWMPRLSIFNKSKKRVSIADSEVLTQEKNKELELSQKKRTIRKDMKVKPLAASGLQSANTEMRKSILMGQNQSQNQPDINAFVRMPTFLIQEEENENNQSMDEDPDTPESAKKTGIIRRVTLRRNSAFMTARSQENKFVHVMDLKKKLHQHLRALRFYIEPDSKWNILYELVHLAVIAYSLFAIPVYACFDFSFGAGLVAVEVLIFLEQIAYIVLSARTAQFASGALTLDNKVIWKKLLDKGIWFDIFSTIPFNLIFGSTSTTSPLLLIAILKLNRILLLFRFPSQLTIFSAKYPKIGKYISFIKPAFYLIFSAHFVACLLSLLFRLEPTEDYNLNFMDYLELPEASLARQYIIFLTFMLSVATTTGYDELIIYNSYERIIFILCIYVGDAVLALVLGWFASSSSTLSDKYTYTFDKIRKIDAVLHQEPIPKKVKDRIISCFSYLVDHGSDNKSCLEYLSGLLPETILKDMTFQQTSLFHNFPLIQEFRRNRTLINEIVANLKLRIYLPKDYIIMRNDFGSQVFCIAKGTVYILSPSSEKKVLGILKPGDFFGELSVYTTTKRLTSFLAQTFCIVYVLEKDVLKNILKAFPHANFEFKLFAKERIEAYTKDMKEKESFHKNYSFLRAMSIKKVRPTKNQVKQIMKSSEIPRFVLPDFNPTDRSPKSPSHFIKFKRLQSSAAEHFKKEIKIEENFSALDSSFSDYVEEEEIQFRHLDNKKKSFRANCVAKERRFSRMKRGKDKTLAKVNGVIVKWGFDFN